MKFKWILLVIVIGLVAATSLLFDQKSDNNTLSILSGSENLNLQAIINRWARQESVNITMNYQGSIDIYRALQQGKNIPYDAIWPANSLWIALGDTQKIVRHEQSIMRSPVILGLKKSIAQRLGWDKKAVKLHDIMQQAQQGTYRLAMTSATQSNSGSSAYIGFLYAVADYPNVLTLAHLANAPLQKQVQQMLGSINRSSGSSGWLAEAFVQHPDRFDAMLNYEAMLIEANKGRVQNGQEPLCAIYPEDGFMVADSPLGFIDKGTNEDNEIKEQLFLKLQQYLLSESIQAEIATTGRRTGLLGMKMNNPDKNIWNPDWCLDPERNIASLPIPRPEVMKEALNLYQTELRKPSLTIWALDVSGSMQGTGIRDLKQAMTTLLDSKIAATHLLQAGKKDITYIIPFNDRVLPIWKMVGNKPDDMQQMLGRVQSLSAEGGTNLYGALIAALQLLDAYQQEGTLWNYLPAIVAMTDGRSDTAQLPAFQNVLNTLSYGRDIPIHSIAFGNADTTQMEQLANATAGRLFIEKQNLADVLRKAKGYN